MKLDPLRLFRPPPAKNLVLAASAGTGKTHALVGVVIHRVVCGPSDAPRGEPVDPARIVATTFSRKAAAEIRARVTRELERLAEAPASSVYFDDLRARCEGIADVGAFLSSRARRALAHVDAARFGTFHSFATGLVRTHAVALGLGPGFDLASEEEARAAVDDAIARAIEARLTTDTAAIHAIVEASGGIDALVRQLRQILERLEEDGRSPRELVLPSGDEEAVERHLRTLVAHAEALTAVPRWAEPARRVVDAWNAGQNEGREAELEASVAALCGMRATGKDEVVEAFADFRGSLAGDTNEQRGRRLVRTYRARRHFAPRASLVRDVLAAAHDELRSRSRSDARLGFGDVLRACRELLRDHPSIADAVSAEIDALLVDEFQDTSRVQRDLLHLLWARPGTRRRGEVPKLEAIRPKGLLVVGDRKQSIYGFRGADVGVFAELAVGLAGEPARTALGIPEGVAWEPTEPLADFCALRHNRRSAADILRFANAFSARRFVPVGATPRLYEIAYVPETEDLLVPPEAEASAAAPAVAVAEAEAEASAAAAPASAASASPAVEAPAAAPSGTASMARTTWLNVLPRKNASSRIEEALVIAERIGNIVAQGTPRVGRTGRPPAFRDIAVLATSHAMLDATAFALAQASIPYVLAGRSFFRTREVRDLAAFLALVTDPNDRLASLAVLRGPWASVHDETLLGLTRPGVGLAPPPEWSRPPHPALVRPEDARTLAELSTLVADLERCAFRIGPGEVLREAVRARRLEDVLSLLPRGEQRVANVRKLLSIADRHGDARALLAWLDDAAEREIAESEAATFSEEDDAVRLLTVHASKGLDFPVVFVPELGAAAARREKGAQRVVVGSGDVPNLLTVRVADEDGVVLEPASFAEAYAESGRRDRAERQRLAYVAVTRAADAMFLVGGRARAPKNEDVGATSIAALEALAADPEALAAARLVVEEVVPPPPRAQAPSAPAASLVDAPPAFADASAPSLPSDLTPLDLTAPSDASLFAPSPSPADAPRRAWRSLSLAPTALADFDHCARRFELVHVLGLPERPRGRLPSADRKPEGATLDARAQGTLAHAVLEHVPLSAFAGEDVTSVASAALVSEGVAADHPQHAVIVGRVTKFLQSDYARSIAEGGARVRREVAFVLDVEDEQGRSVVLRGSMDLVVVWPDGAVDVVDYKSGRRSPGADPSAGAAGAYAFQLDVYALAARSLHPSAPRLRVGLVFLGGDASTPVWRQAPSEAAFRRSLATLGERLVDARWTGHFPRVDVARCESIYCGFIGRCHTGSPTGTDANAVRETTT